MRISHDLTVLVGQTPLVELQDIPCRILVKIESQNPTGSVKDRVALAMLQDAKARGLLSPGGTIVEPTSGNTGIGLCALAAAMGYKAVIVMPENMSKERQQLMKAYGAELVLTPAAGGMAATVEAAKTIAREQGAYLPDQFSNPANPEAHYRTTGPEIWQQTQGQVDLFVAGIGTGGTVTGTGRFLKEQNPNIRVFGIEPASSPVLTQGLKGPHKIQGIGAGFVPAILDLSVLDGVFTVTDEDAMDTARDLARKSGILAGISAGANLWCARHLAALPENRGKTIVTILPDSGQRYLSTGLYD